MFYPYLETIIEIVIMKSIKLVFGKLKKKHHVLLGNFKFGLSKASIEVIKIVHLMAQFSTYPVQTFFHITLPTKVVNTRGISK